jgi:hypothetical protein
MSSGWCRVVEHMRARGSMPPVFPTRGIVFREPPDIGGSMLSTGSCTAKAVQTRATERTCLRSLKFASVKSWAATPEVCGPATSAHWLCPGRINAFRVPVTPQASGCARPWLRGFPRRAYAAGGARSAVHLWVLPEVMFGGPKALMRLPLASCPAFGSSPARKCSRRTSAPLSRGRKRTSGGARPSLPWSPYHAYAEDDRRLA